MTMSDELKIGVPTPEARGTGRIIYPDGRVVPFWIGAPAVVEEKE